MFDDDDDDDDALLILLDKLVRSYSALSLRAVDISTMRFVGILAFRKKISSGSSSRLEVRLRPSKGFGRALAWSGRLLSKLLFDDCALIADTS